MTQATELLKLVQGFVEHKAIDKPKMQQLVPPVIVSLAAHCECHGVVKELLECVERLESSKRKTQGLFKKQVGLGDLLAVFVKGVCLSACFFGTSVCSFFFHVWCASCLCSIFVSYMHVDVMASQQAVVFLILSTEKSLPEHCRFSRAASSVFVAPSFPKLSGIAVASMFLHPQIYQVCRSLSVRVWVRWSGTCCASSASPLRKNLRMRSCSPLFSYVCAQPCETTTLPESCGVLRAGVWRRALVHR